MAVAASSTTLSPASTSTVPAREYRCTGCGYGISVRDVPAECPMCHNGLWEPVEWRPFSTSVTGRLTR
jgi:hypothetical protein